MYTRQLPVVDTVHWMLSVADDDVAPALDGVTSKHVANVVLPHRGEKTE